MEMIEHCSHCGTAVTACMVLVLKFHQKYWSLLDKFVDLSAIYADSPIQIKAQGLSDRKIDFR